MISGSQPSTTGTAKNRSVERSGGLVALAQNRITSCTARPTT